MLPRLRNRDHDIGGGVAGPGGLARGHLVDCAAQAPNVGEPVVAGLLYHLRRHPVGRAAQTLVCERALLEGLFGATEVGQLANSVLSD